MRFCRGCGGALEPSADANGDGAPPEEVGEGRYVVGRFLGEGGRKRVYLAHDSALDRDVALAIVKTAGLNESGRVRVRSEAQAMARLGDHPHVVTVYDIGEEHGEPYIVSQYMEGGAVEDLLQQAPDRRLDIETTLRVARGICSALEHAHDHGIIHRDLKPANIWLTADGTAKLGDFGLAFSLDNARVTKTGAIVGTASYMAPEQALGHQPDAQSDLYSLGAMLYEMVTGRPPFVGDDVVSVISQHANAEPVAPSWHADGVPEQLERLILDLLDKSPEKRPQGAGVVAQRLDEVAAAVERGGGDDRQRSDEPSRVEGLAEGVFVGREREVDKLRTGLEDALGGHGRLLMVVGEPGIGKTRTAEELVTYARLRGARVAVGRSYEAEGAPAYWPWLQVARSFMDPAEADHMRELLGAGATDVARVMPELREMLPDIELQHSLEPEQARFRFFDAVTTFLRNVAAEQPLVLLLDDLHWADAPSLRLLQFLARELSDTSILVIGTYRDVALGRRHPLSQALGDLTRQGLLERVTLRGLSEQEVARFIAVTASIDPPPALVRAIHEETEGNPFFVSEIVNLLASEGELDDPSGLSEWTLTIPQGVREVLGRRLDRLSDDCNQLLAIASVIGREFAVDVLAHVADLPRERTLELLREGEGERILDYDGDPPLRVSFSHALVRDALYEELGPTQRVRLHRRTAAVIEEIYDEDELEQRLEELAHHFLEGQELERAIVYAEAAATRSVEVMAFERAAELYAKAYQALDLRYPTPGRRHVEVLVALGMAQWRATAATRARQTFTRAAKLARELGESYLFAASVLGLSMQIEIGKYDDEVTDLIEEALASLATEDSAIRARLLVRLSVAIYFTRPGERERYAREALEMARRVGEPDTLAAVLEHAHFTMSTPAGTEERVQIATELIEAAERAGDREYAIEGHGMRLIDLLELGDIEGVDREMQIYSQGAMTLREPNFLRYATIRHAMRATLAGRFDEVEPILERHSPQHARHALEPNTVQAFGVVLFTLRRLQGRIGEVSDAFLDFASQYPAVPAWRTGLALLYLELGRDEEAARELSQLAADDFGLLPRDANWVVSLANLSEVAHRLEDRECAAAIYDQLAPYAHRNVVVGGGWVCWGSTSRYLGNLATTLERWEDAEAHYGVALQMNQRLKARPLVALTRLEYASMLAARGRQEDLMRADEMIGEALRVGGELGMRSLVERAFALRVRLQGIESTDVRTSIDAVAAVVEDERPDLSGHAAPDGTVTILFSDIERSTEINERLGDRRWLAVLREHNAIVRDRVRLHNGFEVKSAGDGFMLVFADPRAAVECAVAIQRTLAQRAEDGGEPIRVRMGLHTGEAIRERDDFFGRNVVVAARIAAEARGGEVLVSAPLRDLVDGVGDFDFGDARELTLKGLQGTYPVHAVEWDLARAGAEA